MPSSPFYIGDATQKLERLEASVARLVGEWNEVRFLLGLGTGATGARIQSALDIDRGTAQRLARLARSGDIQLNDLELIPGVSAWVRVVEGVERVLGENHANNQRLAQAVDRFATAIDALGGSRAAAVRAVQSRNDTPQAAAKGPQAARAGLAQSFADLLGYCVDTRLSLVAYRPNPVRPDLLDEVMLQSMLGCAGASGTHPLTLRRFRTRDGSTLASSDASDDARKFFLLRSGTSSPPPEILSTGNEHSQVVMVEPNWSERATPLDVTSLVLDSASGPMPWADPPPILEMETLNRYPTRRLALVYLLDREISQGAVASFAAYADRRIDGLGRAWFDRLPETTPLTSSESLPPSGMLPQVPNFDAILSEMFDRLGWARERFACYHAVVEDPIPLARYVFTMRWPDRE